MAKFVHNDCLRDSFKNAFRNLPTLEIVYFIVFYLEIVYYTQFGKIELLIDLHVITH